MTSPVGSSAGSLESRLQAALGEQYRLGPQIGRGGFGCVFAAEEPGLGRAVAIKVLHPELASPVLRERFRREAASAAQLRHPHIIPIYAVGERDDLSWLVMPRIGGETLRDRLEREGRLPIGEARRVLLEVAMALGAAHEAGIIHRDVKPDNILLEGPERRTVLTDFGIAKSLGSETAGGITTAGLVVGTPSYMSPEQAGGEPAIGPQSDIYSLGVVAYQMLAGVLPFAAKTPGGILMQQIRGPAPPIRRVRPECPEVIAHAVDRCLAIEARDRWQDAGELVAALGRRSLPLQAAGAEAAPALDERRGFRRLAAALGTLVIVALVVDLTRGVVLAAPVAAALATAVLAARYGTLWTRGHGWRDLLGPAPGPGPGNIHVPPPAAPSSTSRARSHRAGILKALAALPRSERARLAHLPEALDKAIAELERLEAAGTAIEAGQELAARIARLRTALEQREVGDPEVERAAAGLSEGLS